MPSDNQNPGEVRRPLLGGGERLELDVELGSGSGPKFHPHSVDEARQLLAPQLASLREGVESTPVELRGERVVFEAKVLPNYLANTYFPKALFEAAGLVPVGARGDIGTYETASKPPEDRQTKVYLLAGDEQSITRMSEIVQSPTDLEGVPPSARDSLRRFDVIRLPTVDEVLRSPADLPSGEMITWEAVINPTVDLSGAVSEREQQAVMAKWVDWVYRLGGEVALDYTRVVKGLTFVPVRLSSDAGPQAARFNPLRTLRPMPKVKQMPVSPLRIVTSSDKVPEPPPGDGPRTNVRVAAFDAGVDDSLPHLDPFVNAIEVTPEPEDPDHVAHGTMVAGAILFGAIEPDDSLRTPDVGLDLFRVSPPPPEPNGQFDVDLYWILDRIAEVVTSHDYPLVNLSLGPALSIEDDDEPHAWTARLDELTEQTGTLFVAATGNNGEADADSGLNRLQVPADIVNGIGVGACDCRSPVAPWRRAPYSAVGPGRPGGRVQPVGLAFGGVKTNPFHGIAAGPSVGEAYGTSFAAPTASHGLASLTALLGQNTAPPSVLRAFAVHYAEPTEDDLSADEGGFGRFAERYDDVFSLAENEVTVLYRNTIARNQSVSLPLTLPPRLVLQGDVKLRWTITFTAPTDPTDAVDYTLAGLEVSLRPHSRIYSFKDPDKDGYEKLHIDNDSERVAELLRAGATLPALPVTVSASRFKNEALRREEGKWETTLHYARGMKALSLHDPKLTVSYLAREGGALTSAEPLDFAMLVSISAPDGVQLYDAVRQAYPILTPLTTQLPLRLRA